VTYVEKKKDRGIREEKKFKNMYNAAAAWYK
jgi:hypothetical protein